MTSRPLWQETRDSLGRPLWQETFDPLDPEPGPEPVAPPAPAIDPLHPAPSPRLIAGNALPGAVVQIVISTVPFQTVMADQLGRWQVSFSGAPGVYSVEARQQGDGSPWSDYSEPMAFTILPEVVPPPSGHAGQEDENRGRQPAPVPQTPVSRLPGVRRLVKPFRRPRAWPGEAGN